MKPFNPNPEVKKWALVAGLVVALGATISINPENKYIARNDGTLGSFELASKGPEKIDISLDGDYKDYKVQGYMSTEKNRADVQIKTEAESCDVCNRLGTITVELNPNDVTNKEYRDMLVKKAVAEKLAEKKVAKSEKKNDKKDKKDKEETLLYTTECSAEDDDGGKVALRELFTCQSEELLEKVEKCEDTAREKKEEKKKVDYRECAKLVKQYYNYEIKENLKKGLSSVYGTQNLRSAEALEKVLVGDKQLIRYREFLASEVTALSREGLKNQVKQIFQTNLDQTRDPKTAFTAAQLYLFNQGNFDAYGMSHASKLYNALRLGARLSDDATFYQDIFSSQFSRPVQNTIQRLNALKNPTQSAMEEVVFGDESGMSPMPIIPGPGQQQPGQTQVGVPTVPRTHSRGNYAPQFQNQTPQGNYNGVRPATGSFNGSFNGSQYPQSPSQMGQGFQPQYQQYPQQQFPQQSYQQPYMNNQVIQRPLGQNQPYYPVQQQQPGLPLRR